MWRPLQIIMFFGTLDQIRVCILFRAQDRPLKRPLTREHGGGIDARIALVRSDMLSAGLRATAPQRLLPKSQSLQLLPDLLPSRVGGRRAPQKSCNSKREVLMRGTGKFLVGGNWKCNGEICAGAGGLLLVT